MGAIELPYDQGQGGPEPGGTGPQGGSDPASALRALIQGARAYMEIEQDDEDLAVAAQVITLIQKLLAKNQKEADAAMGVTPASKFLRRQQG